MPELIPLEGAQTACILFAAAGIAACGCGAAAVICWRLANARRAELTTWIAELFDRWNKVARQELSIRSAHVATALWGVATTIQTTIAVVAKTDCL